MSDGPLAKRDPALAYDVELSAPPQTVWRALREPEFRDVWLPASDLAEPEPITITPGEEILYRLRDEAPPFLESTVTFRIGPTESGGTRLVVLHVLTDERVAQTRRAAANDDSSAVMRAA